jgi:hypothetical protein
MEEMFIFLCIVTQKPEKSLIVVLQAPEQNQEDQQLRELRGPIKSLLKGLERKV